MRVFLIALLILTSSASSFVYAWQSVAHERGTAYRLDGAKISGQAETGAEVYILIEPEVALPALSIGEQQSYRNIIFNYGDSYICGPRREVKVTVDGQLLREREAGQLYDWHVFLKGFLTTHYGEVLSYESLSTPDDSDIAARMLAAKQTITLERKWDNCGDDGVFQFRVSD